MSTAKGASDALATTMVQGFVEQMKAAAKAKGGHLTVQDMEDMQAEFDRQTQALSGALERSFGAYVKAQERSNFDQQRHSPFDRLMVKKFSGLFKDGENVATAGSVNVFFDTKNGMTIPIPDNLRAILGQELAEG